jgi:hypothetical protein
MADPGVVLAQRLVLRHVGLIRDRLHRGEIMAWSSGVPGREKREV